MVLEPLYAENIIVAVIYNEKFKWYVTDKELWYLDYNKLDHASKTLGISVEDEYEADERKGIKVLGRDNVDVFLQRINKNMASKEELHCFLKECIENRTEREEIKIGDVVVDSEKYAVYNSSEYIEMPKREFELLFKLLSYPDRIFSKEQLLDHIWGVNSDSGEETIKTHVSRIRNRLKNITEFNIVTIKGLGYKADIRKDL